jgi:surface protein
MVKTNKYTRKKSDKTDKKKNLKTNEQIQIEKKLRINQIDGNFNEIDIKLPCSLTSFKQVCIKKNILTDKVYKYYLIGNENNLQNDDIISINDTVLFILPFTYEPIPNNETLKRLVYEIYKDIFSKTQYDKYGPMSDWNVSLITDMSYLFYNQSWWRCRWNSMVNLNINNWDVSNVIYMKSMFKHCQSLNPSISEWNVSNVVNMDWMFASSSIRPSITNWNIHKNCTNKYMYSGNSAFIHK